MLISNLTLHTSPSIQFFSLIPEVSPLYLETPKPYSHALTSYDPFLCSNSSLFGHWEAEVVQGCWGHGEIPAAQLIFTQNGVILFGCVNRHVWFRALFLHCRKSGIPALNFSNSECFQIPQLSVCHMGLCYLYLFSVDGKEGVTDFSVTEQEICLGNTC